MYLYYQLMPRGRSTGNAIYQPPRLSPLWTQEESQQTALYPM